jgi:tetratricopeptide (TPR) repeat protein
MGVALQAAELPLSQMLEEASVDAILSGHLESSALGERFQLTVGLHESAPDGQPRDLVVGTYEIPAMATRPALERFVQVRNAIADDVVEHLRPTLESRDLGGLSPVDPEAWRLYLQARERFATITCGDADALLDLLDRSLRLDPEFAVAWVAKGFALYSQSWSCGREAAFAEQALEAARRGRELAPQFPAAVFLEVTLRVEAGEAEEAYALLLSQWSGIESSPFAYLARAYALRYAGFLGLASEAVDQALELDPLVVTEFDWQPTSLLYRGDIERFLEYLPATDVPADRYYRGMALARLGRLDAARETLDPAFRLNPSDLFARFSSCLVATLEGDEATGLEIVRGIVRQRQELGTPDGEMTFKEAQLLAWAGSLDEALVRLQSAVDGGFFCPRCLADEPVFAAARGDSRFTGALERARERHLAFATRFELQPESSR